MKSGLDLRPVFHWTEPRVRGHIMVCFLAFLLQSALRRRLEEAGSEVSYTDLIHDLKQVRAFELELDGTRYLLRPPLYGCSYEGFRSRLDHATQGTWGPGKIPGTIVAAVTEKAVEESGVTQEVIDRYGGLPVAADVGEADRQFICHARQDITRLLEDRKQLLRRISQFEEGARP